MELAKVIPAAVWADHKEKGPNIPTDLGLLQDGEMVLSIFGSPVINGKEPNHKGHQVHKGGKRRQLYRRFSFVFFVS
jgi:hypothetical protein